MTMTISERRVAVVTIIWLSIVWGLYAYGLKMAMAQDAEVIVLSEQEAKEATQIYQKKLEADARWEELRKRYRARHKIEWQEFRFSSDFRAIVPVSAPLSGPFYFGNTNTIKLPNHVHTPAR